MLGISLSAADKFEVVSGAGVVFSLVVVVSLGLHAIMQMNRVIISKWISFIVVEILTKNMVIKWGLKTLILYEQKILSTKIYSIKRI